MMVRRALPALLVLSALGCGGTGQQTTVVPGNPSLSGGNGAAMGGANPNASAVYKPAVGLNSPLGTLRALSDKNPLAKAAPAKATKDSAAQLAKLDKGALALSDAYSYVVSDADAARVAVGEEGLSVPVPKDAKINPDGSLWVVDGETRRVYTLTGVKIAADKPPVVAGATTDDLVRPSATDTAPPLGLVARADEAATSKVEHALRILVKGVGDKDAPVEGTRVRLKAKFAAKNATPLARSLVKALQKYGAVLVPGEGAPALSALADPRWTKDDHKAVEGIHLSDFEIVSVPSKTVKPTDKTEDSAKGESKTEPIAPAKTSVEVPF